MFNGFLGQRPTPDGVGRLLLGSLMLFDTQLKKLFLHYPQITKYALPLLR